MTEVQIARLLKGRVLALTGAGISVASGIAPFTGSGGLYEGLNPYELASPEGFFRDPVKVWSWYLMRIRAGLAAKPNPAHYALKALEDAANQLTIVTTNVDALHQLAGSSSVFRLHGNILETRCLTCGEVAPLEVGKYPEVVDEATLPECPCGGLLRPNVVWFGEFPWEEGIDAIRTELPKTEVVLDIGSSGNVTYGFAEMAAQAGIPTVRINPEPEAYPGITRIAEGAEVALPRLVNLALSTLDER